MENINWDILFRNERSDGHYIRKLDKNPELIQFLFSISFPHDIIEHLYTFSIPQSKCELYLTHYKMLQDENPYRKLDFSFDDWMLAYISAENVWGVVSFDYHVLHQIRKYLNYEAYLPNMIKNLPSDSIVLLDTNILFELTQRNQYLKNEIISMVKENPTITFLASENILIEFQKLCKRKNIMSTPKDNLEDINMININENKRYEEIPEEEIKQFVDNFVQFEPKNHRKKNGEKSQIKKKKNKYSRVKKWENIIAMQ